jgi:hypothetical protein
MALCLNSFEMRFQMRFDTKATAGRGLQFATFVNFGRTGEVGIPYDPADKAVMPAVNALWLPEESETGSESRRSPMPDLIQQGQQQQHRDTCGPNHPAVATSRYSM